MIIIILYVECCVVLLYKIIIINTFTIAISYCYYCYFRITLFMLLFYYYEYYLINSYDGHSLRKRNAFKIWMIYMHTFFRQRRQMSFVHTLSAIYCNEIIHFVTLFVR